MKIDTTLTGEIKWGTGREREVTIRLKGRGDMEDGERERVMGRKSKSNECKSKVM